MVFMSHLSFLLVDGRITIDAAVWAGGVGADVGALRAAAFRPGRFQFIGIITMIKQAADHIAVNAMGLFNFSADQIVPTA